MDIWIKYISVFLKTIDQVKYVLNIYLGNIWYRRASVFFFSSVSCFVLSATISSKLLEYASRRWSIASRMSTRLKEKKGRESMLWWVSPSCVLLHYYAAILSVISMYCSGGTKYLHFLHFWTRSHSYHIEVNLLCVNMRKYLSPTA